VTVPVILRAAPVATFAELSEPQTVRVHELYDRAALQPRPGLDLHDVPIRVDHDDDAPPIGRVTALRVDTCWNAGGTWAWIHAELADPPSWLRVGATAVSIGRSAFETRRPHGADWQLILRAILSEVSLLTPGTMPAFPGAAVAWIGEPITRAAAEPAGEQVIHHAPGTRMRRVYDNAIVGVR
jgi:hypothetical protein